MLNTYYFLYFSLIISVLIVSGNSKWIHDYYVNLDDNSINDSGSMHADTIFDQSMISLDTSSTRMCILDKLHISWNISTLINIDLIGIMFMKSSYSQGSIILLQDILHKETQHVSLLTDNLILCSNNTNDGYNDCKPTIDSILVRPETNHLILVFNQETNQPILSSINSIHNAFDIKPYRIRDPNAKGNWISSTRLEIEINAEYLQRILYEHQKGNKIDILVRCKPVASHIIGSTAIRSMEHGLYQISFVDINQNRIIYPSSTKYIEVLICNDATVIPSNSLVIDSSSSSSRMDHHDHKREEGINEKNNDMLSSSRMRGMIPSYSKKPAGQLFYIQGVLAITGHTPIKLAHTSLPNIFNSGTWSFGCWIRIIEPASQAFRSIMYKGDINGSSRTPSIWLHPDSNRLSIRVSTIDNPDLGADSIAMLPHNEWVHVTVVFHNQTIHSEPSSPSSMLSRNKSKDISNGLHMNYPTNYYHISEGNDDLVRVNKEQTIGYEYRIALYINGQLDIDMQFSTVVLGNPHPLHLFNDISHTGPKAFVRDLTIWDRDLTGAEIKAKYLSGTWDHSDDFIDHTLDLFQLANNPLAYNNNKDIVDNYKFNDISILKEDFVTNSSVINNDPIAEILLEKAKVSAANCEAFATRLDLYTEAAEHGSSEALYYWAMMMKYGTETGTTQCGAEDSYTKSTSFLSSASTSLTNIFQRTTTSTTAADIVTQLIQDQATYAFLYAAEMGHKSALVQLALILLHGTGASPLIRNPLEKISPSSLYIPVHPNFIFSPTQNSGGSSSTRTAYYGLTRIHIMIAKYLLESHTPPPPYCNIATEINDVTKSDAIDLGSSVLDSVDISMIIYQDNMISSSSNVTCASIQSSDNSFYSLKRSQRGIMNATSLAIGILHLSALHNIPEAHQTLAYRYKNGIGVISDLETSLYYLQLPAKVTNEEFHRIGGQPIVENDRISDKTAPEISKGNQGLTDELIQHQIVRAQEGHLPSILAMGDLYYYGARGLPRDQALALRYFEQAVEQHGDPIGMCGAAGMYLKGEGTAQNISRAILLYENASSIGSIRALNGLGYMYFYGQSVPKNASKAFQYFLMAAAYETDADSIFNAGHCLEHGIGTPVNVTKAVEYYTFAANRLGDFNSIQSLGNMFSIGHVGGVERSATIAWSYLNVATTVGPWSSWIRRGLDQYFQKKYHNSLNCYLYAGELGIEVSQSNAAYILRTKLSLIPQPQLAPVTSSNLISTCFGTFKDNNRTTNHCIASSYNNNINNNSSNTNSNNNMSMMLRDPLIEWRNRLLRRQYELSSFHDNKDSLMHIGNCYFKAQCGVKSVDYRKAIGYYTKASHAGHSLSSAYLSVMNQFGIGLVANKDRAERYYQLALKQKDNQETDIFILQTLKYALTMNNYNLLTPIHYIMERTVKLLWNL